MIKIKANPWTASSMSSGQKLSIVKSWFSGLSQKIIMIVWQSFTGRECRASCIALHWRAAIGLGRKLCHSSAFARKNMQIWHILHFMVFCLSATSSSLLLLTCHLLTGNDFVIENLSQADATATPHVAPQMRPRRPTVGPNGKKPPNIWS